MPTKKGETALRTTRPSSIQLVPGTEASPIELVDVVSPAEGTGNPQLTRALRYVRYTTRTRVAESLEGIVQEALT